ncbi:transmembrane rhomboid family protein [Flavobacterium sp. 316]|uniref:Rhomboid family intramembrane serine protease n=1 Tax=Flavobacterium sediminilitoris TaxID=2024526 RepID=A0ABY4HLB8_9FLAO|nr:MULTISPECIES: rhomboid family intramembrane serine protease [Flavobacterium]KIX22013.1 transmembrane rhomboid family protein [Flavobacterium sp. 316]UOX32274.1 rhomboid family intramembrane serine protease [Flavobacterium sediminilitoris]
MNIIEDIKQQYKTGGIVQRLIFWNIGIFVLSIIFFFSFKTKSFNYPIWLGLFSDNNQLIFRPWTLISYMFLHAGFLHLFFNLMVLHFSGRLFINYFTGRQLLGLYILGGIFSGLIFLISFYILGEYSVLVGASGAIMSILIAVATYAPYMLLRMPLIGTVKLWQVAAVIVLLDLIQVPISNTGGHLAHLGGALFGFLYVKLLKNGTDLSKGISKLQDAFEDLISPKKKTPFKTVHKNTSKTTTFTNQTTNIDQKKIDDILDRISKSGYDSLSKEEKDFLFKTGK